jgi:hypothetical protein
MSSLKIKLRTEINGNQKGYYKNWQGKLNLILLLEKMVFALKIF